MNERNQLVYVRILTELERRDGTPLNETILHASAGMNVEPRITLDEFDAAIRHCESERWIRSVTGPAGLKWVISDKGRAALLELRA